MKTSKFWNYMAGMSEHCQPLYNWRHKLKDELDFEAFKEKFLIPIDEFAERIICPDVCPMSCDRNVVRQYNGDKYEAVCQEWPNKFFVIEEIDTLIYRVRPSRLNEAIADALGIHFDQMKMRGTENSWRIGEYPLKKGGTCSTFVTLEYSQFRIMELIIDCNRLTRNGYLLLGTNKNILNQKCEEMLFERGATFVAMNETLDLNGESEFYLLKPIEITEAKPLNKDSDNIFRKCGDVWEVRFQGGEKFMLTGVDTGAEYIRYLLERSGERIPVLDIVGGFPAEDQALDDEFLEAQDGYSIGDLPVGASGFVSDPRAISEYREELGNLSDKIEEAMRISDDKEIVRLQDEIHKIRKCVNESVSPQGHEQKLNDPIRNVENSFRNAVNRAINKIRNYDEALASHLDTFIQRGMRPVYFSQEGIKWNYMPD